MGTKLVIVTNKTVKIIENKLSKVFTAIMHMELNVTRVLPPFKRRRHALHETFQLSESMILKVSSANQRLILRFSKMGIFVSRQINQTVWKLAF